MNNRNMHSNIHELRYLNVPIEDVPLREKIKPSVSYCDASNDIEFINNAERYDNKNKKQTHKRFKTTQHIVDLREVRTGYWIWQNYIDWMVNNKKIKKGLTIVGFTLFLSKLCSF